MNKQKFLIGFDLEDVRDWVQDGMNYAERVPENTNRFLKWLQAQKAKATFFVVGTVARRYPSLIKEITEDGHEVACHSDLHIQLTKQTKLTFTDDLKRNIDALNAAGAKNIQGFRAPTFSLVKETQWAYEVLENLGFKYSSSVLPAKNPLYGWKEFGSMPVKIGQVLEIPVCLTGWKFFNVPLAGGVYFRVLPLWALSGSLPRKKNIPIPGYFHPYDLDTEQEKFMHPDLNNNRLLNYLMYMNRKGLLDKISSFITANHLQPVTYADYAGKYFQPRNSDGT